VGANLGIEKLRLPQATGSRPGRADARRGRSRWSDGRTRRRSCDRPPGAVRFVTRRRTPGL